MAKLTLDQKIEKVKEQIAKEESIIEVSKEKIKKLTTELKALQMEKEQSFANDIIKLMKSKGITQEQILAQISAQATAASSDTVSSPSDNSSADSGSKY